MPNVYTPSMFVPLKIQPRCLCRHRQVRPEIVIKGALKYEGESTVWREYEVSDGTIWHRRWYRMMKTSALPQRQALASAIAAFAGACS